MLPVIIFAIKACHIGAEWIYTNEITSFYYYKTYNSNSEVYSEITFYQGVGVFLMRKIPWSEIVFWTIFPPIVFAEEPGKTCLCGVVPFFFLLLG